MSIERYTHNIITPWTGEHLHRYNEALTYIQPGDIILDIATGSGYGAAMLARVNKSIVYGGDIDPEAIERALNAYNKSNLHFKLMNACELPFDNNSLDKIISFETIEHTKDFEAVLIEFARTLRPNAILLLSTPNIKVSSPDGVIRNKYHTQEFTYDQLYVLLSNYFSKVEILGQFYSRYSKNASIWMKYFELFLLLRGIRKIPYKIRNACMKAFTGFVLYPTEKDFSLSRDKEFIENNCFVLFAICQK